MSEQLCGWNLINNNWQNKGICQTPSKPFCREKDYHNSSCSTDNTKNLAQFNYAEPPKFCGYHYNYTNGNWENKGKCTTSNKPCCSSQYSGTCGNTCTLNKENDYIAPASTVQSNCNVSNWSECNAPVCNGKQDTTTGTQTRNYTSTSNCTIPQNTPLSQSCTKTCNPAPERCGVGSSNNITKCTKFNDCCSSDGYCGQGPNFCQSNTQYMYCGNIDEQNKYDSYGNIKPSYKDNLDKCFTPKTAVTVATGTGYATAPTTATTTTATTATTTQPQQQTNQMVVPKPPGGTTQCGRDKAGSYKNSSGVEYGKCKNAGECCSGYKNTSFYGWCGPQGNTDYCFNDAQSGYGRVPKTYPW
jgi:hypothetical protein